MTRKQKAEKLRRRREAQVRHRGRVRVEEHGKHTIEVPVGPKPARGFRKSDPPRHGAELKAAEQIVSFCDRLGFDPAPHQLEWLRELYREGRLTERAVVMTARRRPNPYGLIVDTTISAPSATQAQETYDAAAEMVSQDGFVKVDAIAPVADHPSVEEWDALVRRSKSRRRSIAKLAPSNWELRSPDADQKDRLSWRVS